ncbi:GntR family transcriptional regulator [Martelella limonii]|uniref:GntR family transcriptional regulator n=1 Tax=Martelella limonii TaxID=1647649 RepID=UPI001580D84C|nr:GntR family transcriptional regulator [Martelella limonii]
MLEKTSAQKMSLGDRIAGELEEQVISGGIPAGAKLDETAIAAQFSVSRTPVREALHILCGRGLADRIAYKGVVVTRISPARIDEMFEAMAELEAVCGRLACHRMTMSERAELQKLHREMEGLAAIADSSAYESLNTRFHTLIFAGCHNTDIIASAEALRLKLAPFRKYQLGDAGRLKRSSLEHQQIVDSILDQNPEAAESALRRHLISAAHEVVSRRQDSAEMKPEETQ